VRVRATKDESRVPPGIGSGGRLSALAIDPRGQSVLGRRRGPPAAPLHKQTVLRPALRYRDADDRNARQALVRVGVVAHQPLVANTIKRRETAGG
jgi:hypothetical protein